MTEKQINRAKNDQKLKMTNGLKKSQTIQKRAENLNKKNL